MKDASWIILDTETDGLFNPIHIIEIAAQRMKGWSPDGAPFQVFLNHGVRIPPAAKAIHGYTQNFLHEHGIDPRRAHQGLGKYVGDLPIVAHNIAFDWNRALIPEWQRLHLDTIGQRGFCTMTLSRRVIDETPNCKLETLKHYFCLGGGTSHQAANDVATVVELCRRVIGPRLEPLQLETFTDIARFAKKSPIAECLSLIKSQQHRQH